MSLKNVKRPLIFLGMILCLGWLVTGCATSQQLAEVQDQSNLALETAEKALAEAQAAKVDAAKADAAASGAAEDADIAEAAAVRAERAATKAEAMADKTENIFMKKMKK
jgi:regulator of protease activity HflC (stomatin/prohibitin superfamily)